jgi:hypothetical protein
MKRQMEDISRRRIKRGKDLERKRKIIFERNLR